MPFLPKQYVRVVKPFQETRTPCPRAGTVGRIKSVSRRDGSIKVAFWTFTDAADGAQWGPGQGDGSQPFVFSFKPVEIELVTENAAKNWERLRRDIRHVQKARRALEVAFAELTGDLSVEPPDTADLRALAGTTRPVVDAACGAAYMVAARAARYVDQSSYTPSPKKAK